MAHRNHHADASYGAAELDDTTSGSGIVLVVPRDADTAVLQSELSKLPGLEGIHTEFVRHEGFCIAQFDSQAAARHAHETILAADSQLGPYLVQCYHVDHGAAQSHNVWGGPSDHLRLPETLYETGPLTQNMPGPASPRAVFNEPVCHPAETGSQRGPSSLTSTMTPHSNSTTVGGGGGAGGPAGGFWSPPLSMTGGAGASAPNSSGAPGSSSQLALLAQQRLGQQAGAAHPRYDNTAQCHQLAQMFQGLSTSQDEYPGSGGHHDSGSGNPGGGVRGPPSLRTTAFPPSSMPFDSDGVPSAGSGGSSNWHGRVACGTPSAYPTPNMQHPGLSGSGYSGLREVGSGGAAHAYGLPPPPFAPHGQRLPSSNVGGYPLDIVGPPSTDEFTGPGGSNNGGPYGWQGHMANSQGGGGGGGSAERSRQRLFVVVSKSATEEQIAKQFKKFGGMEYCNLKRDKRTGASKGYCFVNFSTVESAAAAMKALNGIEFPTGSGKNLRVEYSEVLPSARQGMPPTSRPSSTNSHGSGAFKADSSMYDSHMPYPQHKAMHDPRAPRSQEHPGSQGHQQRSPERQPGMAYAGNITDFVAAHNYDPNSGVFAAPSGGGYPACGGRGGGTSRSRGEAPVAGDPCRLFVHVAPHLPEHAVRHLFEAFGTVLSVAALEDESCYWVVRFEDAAAAAAASSKLNGANILGSVLTVEPSDMNGPLRPRFLGVSSISTYSSHYPSSRGPSSQGISSTGSMQAAAFGGKMAHYYDGGGWAVGSGGSHFPPHTHASPPRFMPQVVEGGGIRGSSGPPGARNGSGSLPSSGQSPVPQPGGHVHF